MTLWTLVKKPTFHPDAVATESGWADPNTGELYVTIRQLPEKRREFTELPVANIMMEDGSFLLLEDDSDRPNFLLQE